MHAMQSLTGATLFALLLLAFSFSAGAEELALPNEMTAHMGGSWQVELLSPCASAIMEGTANFENETVELLWKERAAPTPIVPVNGTHLNVGALTALCTESSAAVYYQICDVTENYMHTPARPSGDKKMQFSYMREYSGVLTRSATPVACTDDMERTMHIRLFGQPFPPADSATFKQKNAVQYAEIMVNTKELEGSCAVGPAATTASEAKPKKRRAHKMTGGAAVSATSEAPVMRGYATLRLTRKSPIVGSFYERYNSILIFVVVFTVSQLTRSFFMNRASK
ncbi:hypothetical protein STCU_11842 [Strigomonas culicis]|uniref:Uncharacterized protein n=1 Tax=Strigomonas culicis TaxID=28005 RepID=S9TFG9_9TRYP|nr:hypothetical protein STCU_11842 [Strigomonas culicis]|eukprot:EPY15669.1 hypothetical protein STCU_11842 [Strigomonas culicis]